MEFAIGCKKTRGDNIDVSHQDTFPSMVGKKEIIAESFNGNREN